MFTKSRPRTKERSGYEEYTIPPENDYPGRLVGEYFVGLATKTEFSTLVWRTKRAGMEMTAPDGTVFFPVFVSIVEYHGMQTEIDADNELSAGC